MSKNKNLIAVTMGDPSGISTEITIKAWIKKNTNLKFFLIHDPVYVSRVIKKMKVGLKVQIINNPSEALSVNKKYLPVIPIKIDAKTQLGERNYSNAGAILQSIDMAIDFAKQKVISGIVTNPINKEVIAKKLMRFKGHTEYLAKKDKKSSNLTAAEDQCQEYPSQSSEQRECSEEESATTCACVCGESRLGSFELTIE